jgi:hypothetical protein
MMSLLLKHEGYPPAVVVAVLLHGLLLWFIFDRSMESREFVKIDRPASIAASTVAANPQRLRRIEQLELQRQQRGSSHKKDSSVSSVRSRRDGK